MNIVFKHLELENFCGLKKFETDFYDRTMIKGQNKVGKSTIRNAIYWLLTDKLSDGGAIDGIRPRDEEGNDIHQIDVIGCLTIDVDGKEIRVKKTYSENWVKNKTTQNQEFKGNETTYEINEIPKRKKDFEEYLNQFIDLDNLSFCMNPLVFLRMNNKERRNTLFSLVDNADTDVLASDKRFAELESDLQDGTIDELIIRSKSTIKRCNERIAILPDLMTAEESHIVELSDDEVKALRKELSEEEAKITKLDTVAETANELSRRISDGKVRLTKIDTDYRVAVQKAEANQNIEKGNLVNAIAMGNGTIKGLQGYIADAKKRQDDITACIKGYAESIKEIEAETFDDSNLTCPVCGSKYTKAKVESMRKAWEDSQTKKIGNLKHLADDSELRYHEVEADIEKWTADITAKQAEITGYEQELAVIENMPAPTVAMPDTKEKDKLTADISKWEKELESLSLATGTDRQAILDHIKEINIKLNALVTNDAFRAKSEEYRQELLKLSQQVADEERKLDLMQLYQRTKIGAITDAINEYFHVIKWRFFKPQINGSYAEVCEPLVNGVSLDGLLNRGDSILAMADLCMAFQRKAEVSVPIILDDCESVDEWRLPTADNQLLFIRRTDDKTLVVENLS